MDATRFHIEEIRFAERDVTLQAAVPLRRRHRHGLPTGVCASPHPLCENGGTAEGCAAEMMVPKWFDKNPSLTNEQNFEQLALRPARCARRLCRPKPDAQTAWTHFASNYAALQARAKANGLQPLVASYGPALIDRAVLDALCLHHGRELRIGDERQPLRHRHCRQRAG
jgi:hypothetical protein